MAQKHMPDHPEGSGETGNPSPDMELEDALAGIDWADLQAFFLEHLRGQLLEMRALLAKGDAKGLARLGHSLKGSGGGVKLPRFTDWGRDLEEAGIAEETEGILLACQAIRDEYLIHRPAEAAALHALFEGVRFGTEAA